MRSKERTLVPRRRFAKDVKELIRMSDLLRHRSWAVQRAADSASVRLRDLLQRSIEVSGK